MEKNKKEEKSESKERCEKKKREMAGKMKSDVDGLNSKSEKIKKDWKS